MKKVTHPTWDYFKLVLFVFFLTELVLFFMAILFGRLLGYDWTLTACLWLGLIVAACFALIVIGNLLIIIGKKLISVIMKRT